MHLRAQCEQNLINFTIYIIKFNIVILSSIICLCLINLHLIATKQQAF